MRRDLNFAVRERRFHLTARFRRRDKSVPLNGIYALRSLEDAHSSCVDPKDARRICEDKAGGEGWEKKVRERGKAHRRLTRIYGFVGLANKESARETGFSGRHSLPRARVESLVAVESTKTLDPRDISDIVARVNGQRERRIYGHARLHEPRIRARQGEGNPADPATPGPKGRPERERERYVAEHVIREDSLMALTRRIDVPFHAHISFW